MTIVNKKSFPSIFFDDHQSYVLCFFQVNNFWSSFCTLLRLGSGSGIQDPVTESFQYPDPGKIKRIRQDPDPKPCSPPPFLHPLPPPSSNPTFSPFHTSHHFQGWILSRVVYAHQHTGPTKGVARAVNLLPAGYLKIFKALWALYTLKIFLPFFNLPILFNCNGS